ncbi:MAG: glycogen synthase GlgA [Candidatus Omnitrophica bacterium]|nr:glycogen synthase GlgA [Candidatus Omnitrophota bacterium]
MKVLFCSSEVVPFAKTGGLADVAGALPVALEREGTQVKVALPKYRSVKDRGATEKMGKNVEVYLVENEKYFDRKELYGEGGADYPDNLERFSFFCKQLLDLLQKNKFKPDIIHCNDWQTALIPIYLQTTLSDNRFFQKTKTIFTIHNLAYQGLFGPEQFPLTGLNNELFNMQGLEFYGKVNLLKGGLLFSKFITTVSPTYAKEIQEPQFGCGLEGVLKERSNKLFGIINGLDYSVWNPSQDKHIFQKYDASSLSSKYKNKTGLQEELGLPKNSAIPLIGIITRLAEQKGIELVIGALNKMAKSKLQFVLLGTGDEKYHVALEKIKKKGYKNISIQIRFDNTLAHKIYAGSDMFLMPSYYEPCGLGQLISFKYGTIPIVRKTGGLADTVVDFDASKGSGNGFVFTDFTSEALFNTITRSIAVYSGKKALWSKLAGKVMQQDFSWNASAKEYIKLYRRALDEK